MEKAKAQGYKDIVVLLPRKKLPHTPANIHTMQKQMKALFAQVLDLDLSPKESVQQKMVQYYNNRGGDQLNTFQFQPQAMSFEIIGPKTFTEVLYPKDIYDIIDYFVREFVKRKQPIRLCKTADGTLLFPGVSTQNTVTALLMIKAARVRIWARPMSGDRKAER